MRNIWKKTLTLLLALCLVAGLLPLGALADTAISVRAPQRISCSALAHTSGNPPISVIVLGIVIESKFVHP